MQFIPFRILNFKPCYLIMYWTFTSLLIPSTVEKNGKRHCQHDKTLKKGKTKKGFHVIPLYLLLVSFYLFYSLLNNLYLPLNSWINVKYKYVGLTTRGKSVKKLMTAMIFGKYHLLFSQKLEVSHTFPSLNGSDPHLVDFIYNFFIIFLLQ